MSRENRLKRLGLWHLRDKPEELRAALESDDLPVQSPTPDVPAYVVPLDSDESDEPVTLGLPMRNEDLIPSEEYFLLKIDDGLHYRSLSPLDERERAFLCLSVDQIDNLGNDPEVKRFSRELWVKSVGCLAEAYARDTAGKNTVEARKWRNHLELLDAKSNRVIAGVVTQWYESVGRPQEKHATGCLIILVVLTLFLVL